jgi:RNA polymerase sigma-70 factor (ECF subfamily)
MIANAGPDPEHLLLLARAGSGPALGQLLELYRNYLALLVRVQIGRRLQGKADSADLVQEAFLEATAHFDQFRGTSEAELAAWLRQILVSRLARLVRHYCSTQRRDIRLERQLADEMEQSSRCLGLVAPGSTPSQRASRREQSVLLADALGRLPEAYREVLVLHHLQGLTLAEVAGHMGRSLDSIKKLWLRGLGRLRRVLEEAP